MVQGFWFEGKDADFSGLGSGSRDKGLGGFTVIVGVIIAQVDKFVPQN